MRVCPRCGEIFSDAFRFCGVDATPLLERQEGDSLLGQTVEQRYRLQALLGKGGFGAVYRAVDERLRREVAVKILSKSGAENADQVAHFKREISALAALKHPHVVNIHDGGLDPEMGYFFVMELLRGQDLGARLDCGPLPILDTFHILRQAGGALQFVHELGLVHRDIKPENIFLCLEPGVPHGCSVRLLDFGITKAVDAGAGAALVPGPETGRGSVVLGTPYVMSPEQLTGRPVDARSDIYSLGVVLFEMLAGVVPFPASSYEELVRRKLHEQPPVPSSRPGADWIVPELDRLVLSMLARDPAERPQRVADVLAELEPMRARVEDAWAVAHLIPGPGGRRARAMTPRPETRRPTPSEAATGVYVSSLSAQAPAGPAGGPTPAAASRPSTQVLVVDDDESIRSLLQMIVESEGCRCATADSGEAAWAWLSENPTPEAIVLDVLMPTVDGLTILRQLRSQGYEGPVIVCSNLAAEEVRAEAESVEGVWFLNKARDLHRIPELLTVFGVGVA